MKKLLTLLFCFALAGGVYAANDFYTHGGFPATGSTGSSSGMRAELDTIMAGFDKLPALSGNANKAVVINGGATGLTITTGTFSLAGNFATTGAFNTSFTQGASTTLILPLVNGTLATLAGTETFTTKTFNLTSNTLTGTTAQFNTALSDNDFATLAGAESLTNKTIPSPVLSGTATGTYTLGGTPTVASPTFSGTASGSLTNLSLTTPTISGTPTISLLDTKGDLLAANANDTPAKLAAGANGTILLARSQATAGLAYVAALNKIIYGLTYANNAGDVTNDLDIAAGGAMDATGAYFMVGSSSTKQTDVAWAVGSAAGCLDTGAVGNSDYYLWKIVRSDTGVVDDLCSLSSSAPTMPSNYDFKRLYGWYKRVAGAVVLFHTYETDGGGLELLWDTPTVDINLSNTLTTARRVDAVKVPLNFSVVSQLGVVLSDVTTGETTYIYCPDLADVSPATIRNAVSQPTSDMVVQMSVRTNASGQIAARSTLSTVDVYTVYTLGFAWSRRN